MSSILVLGWMVLEWEVTSVSVIKRGELLKEILASKGWNQEHLAKASGVHKSTISRIINYNQDYTVDVAEKLAGGLDVPVGRLLGEDVVTEDPFIRKINRLPAKKRALLRVFVDALESAQVDFKRADEGLQPMILMLPAAGY